ncbi:MAG: sulfatase [Myxococcota bacterium]
MARSALILSLLALLGSSASAETHSRAVRGVLLITIDALRADHVGAYGDAVATPNLDALARDSVVLEHATTPVPTTAPAIASLLTGLHPWRHRVLRNVLTPLSESSTTLAEVARSHGIHTSAFVGSLMVSDRFGFGQGFEHFEFEPTRAYDWRHRAQALPEVREQIDRGPFFALARDVTHAAMIQLTRLAGDEPGPFLIWLHYFDPHTPYAPPARYALSPDAPVDLRGKTVPEGIKGEEELRSLIRGYRGEVRYIDAEIGRLVGWLRRLDLLDRTAIVFTADHGEGLGEHGILEHSSNLSDELIHVPLFIRAPGLAARRLAGAAQLEDLFPTVLDLLGVHAESRVDGVSLLPWLRGEQATSPRFASVGRRRALQVGPTIFYQQRWPTKWVGVLGQPGRTFRLDRDPDEAAGQPGAPPPEFLVGRLGVGDPDPPTPLPQNDEILRALRSLGYVE